MRFFKQFSRWKGPGGTVLGTDALPTTPPNSSTDNLLISPAASRAGGWPAHRVAVTYHGPAGAPNLPATLVFYESLTGRWYGIGGTVALVPEMVSFFSVLALLDPAAVGPDQLNSSSGSLSVTLLVTDPGGTPNGEYVFAVAPSLV
jgi:hypothetical protein